MKTHEYFIQKCISLARKGALDVSPNPMVGCVIVNDGEIIGEGYHKEFGKNHAEVNAINSVKDKSTLRKSILYVNLEPCCHHGKTPPCTDLIIKYNIQKVVIGCKDTFSKVSGKGIKKLKDNSVDVIYGVLEKDCVELNKRFFCYHIKKRPYIILKWAKSKDNFIAPINQEKPFWMTSEKSKKLVHSWRAEEDAILVGRKTVVADNPFLTVRTSKGKNPKRIIIDKKLLLDIKSNVFDNQADTIVFNNIKSAIIDKTTYLKADFNNLNEDILNQLYNRNILSLIVEGGAITINSFIATNLYDEIRVFTSDKLLKNGVNSPELPDINLIETSIINNDKLEVYKR
ncbi:MAG: bifunctional diaminohydroxyphosphoribosylaminopyrimidine deaminase/5-amino-6-(5-phosphoribosylamino)uracil reductase RibD [Flavobacteriales bacterium]|nr:bifunctional diaminohydroxyphosphoribosylaminopyrimidine deaminase/5-amino-6-(5-phosphoribosylamino)uracil reductase RibD [Flavobacteriales bacterium]